MSSMRLKKHFIYIVLLAGVIPLAGFIDKLSAEEPINPHWTGKYCQECHVNKSPAQQNAARKFSNDPLKLCDRCHTKPCITNQSHPANAVSLNKTDYTIPAQWPLKDGKLSCLTCHDAIPPMYDNFPLKWYNLNFLRGGPYKKNSDFCLACHLKVPLQKANPHKQLDAQGKIIQQTCLICHAQVPDPRQAKDLNAVTFKEPYDAICLGCHPRHPGSHGPETGQPKLSADMNKSLTKQQRASGIELPLVDDHVFCGTCHNPHEKGVIQRPEEQSGAGEKNFLRMMGGYELCVSCHADKQFKDRSRLEGQHALGVLKATPAALVSHKPYLENKCKACHQITPQHREKPEALFLCFRQGCHKPELVEKPFVHPKSVLENCYGCHESHVSGYGKLLRVDEQTECYSCHPLLKDKNKKELPKIDLEKSNKEHRTFAAYVRTSAVPKGMECGFCHSRNHRAYIGSMAPGACADCHMNLRKILRDNASQQRNVHETFKERLCSKCHDPHASKYQYQLKNPPETYLK